MSLSFIPILVISVFILLTITCTAIFFHTKKDSVGAWIMGWVIFFMAAFLLLSLPVNKQVSFLFVLLHSYIIIAALLLCWGTHHFFAKGFSPIWIYSALLIIGWMITGNILRLPPQYYMFPAILLIAALDICNGVIWLNSSHDNVGKHISGWAFILLGLHHLDAPFLYLNYLIVPWGYFITISLSILAILGSLRIYMEFQQKELRESEERFRLLAENANDLVFRYRLSSPPGYEYVSPSVINFNGYTPEEHYADPNLIYKSVHPDDQYMFAMMGKNLNNSKGIIWLRFVRKDGRVIWTEQRYKYIFDEQGSIVAIQGIIRDITERQQMERQIEYVSIHDSLTDLYNRSFFEAKLSQFEEFALLPIGIILCDVDGLKLVNDSFGHDAGDQLLIHAAGVLRDCSQPEDIVARIGGDEFAILMPESDETRTNETADRINKTIDSYNLANPNSLLSLSIGYAVKKDTSITLQEILKEADYNMYQKKLYRSQSSRSTIVRTLTNTLRERDCITEGHSERLQEIVTQLGRSVNLSETKLADIRLFSNFHDIGKVGIPDRILLKPAPLSNEERREMQRHCEIGYRLARSGPELSHIADWILKHHEWWDGNGYPMGISGEEIPLECRILSIADAYDAMISSRPYREGMAQHEALTELKKYAGSQFDPYLVDKFVALMRADMLTENKMEQMG